MSETKDRVEGLQRVATLREDGSAVMSQQGTQTRRCVFCSWEESRTTDRVDLALVKWSLRTSKKSVIRWYVAMHLLQEIAWTQRFTSVNVNVAKKMRQAPALKIQGVLDLSVRRILNQEKTENACLDLQMSAHNKVCVPDCEGRICSSRMTSVSVSSSKSASFEFLCSVPGRTYIQSTPQFRFDEVFWVSQGPQERTFITTLRHFPQASSSCAHVQRRGVVGPTK